MKNVVQLEVPIFDISIADFEFRRRLVSEGGFDVNTENVPNLLNQLKTFRLAKNLDDAEELMSIFLEWLQKEDCRKSSIFFKRDGDNLFLKRDPKFVSLRERGGLEKLAIRVSVGKETRIKICYPFWYTLLEYIWEKGEWFKGGMYKISPNGEIWFSRRPVYLLKIAENLFIEVKERKEESKGGLEKS